MLDIEDKAGCRGSPLKAYRVSTTIVWATNVCGMISGAVASNYEQDREN